MIKPGALDIEVMDVGTLGSRIVGLARLALGKDRVRVALLDPVKLNVGVTVFVLLSTNRHNQEWFEKLRAIVADIPEVVDFYRMSGNIDYLLRIVVPDIAAYDAVYRKLTSQIEIFGVNSSFAMEEIKHTTALPLEYIKPGD